MNYLFVFLALALLVMRVAYSSTPAFVIEGDGPVSAPLPADYRFNPDGSVDLRVCFNWSCSRMEAVSFSADELEDVVAQMAYCKGDSLYQRLQQIRIGIWKMELLAQKYLPVLNNDRELNELDKDIEGRTDCVDNSSNSTVFLHILGELSMLPGWSVALPRVRKLLAPSVHWTAVVVDENGGDSWSVDSWYRHHGHLPFVMPLADWIKEKKAWEGSFNDFNPYPSTVKQLCGGNSTETDY